MKLEYKIQHTSCNTRNQKRNIWFNPPVSKNIFSGSCVYDSLESSAINEGHFTKLYETKELTEMPFTALRTARNHPSHHVAKNFQDFLVICKEYQDLIFCMSRSEKALF